MIVFKKQSLYQSKKGLITSIIFFDFGDFYFPEKNWNDFSVIILSWWLESIRNFDNYTELMFMDGSYKVIIEKDQNGKVFLKCKIDEVKEFILQIKIKILEIEIKKISNEVIQTCNDRGYVSDDLDKLILLNRFPSVHH